MGTTLTSQNLLHETEWCAPTATLTLINLQDRWALGTHCTSSTLYTELNEWGGAWSEKEVWKYKSLLFTNTLSGGMTIIIISNPQLFPLSPTTDSTNLQFNTCRQPNRYSEFRTENLCVENLQLKFVYAFWIKNLIFS